MLILVELGSDQWVLPATVAQVLCVGQHQRLGVRVLFIVDRHDGHRIIGEKPGGIFRKVARAIADDRVAADGEPVGCLKIDFERRLKRSFVLHIQDAFRIK